MPEGLSQRQLDILRAMRGLSLDRRNREVGVAEVAQALYGKDQDLTPYYSLVQGDMMDLAERGLVEQCPSLHEWRLPLGGVQPVDVPE